MPASPPPHRLLPLAWVATAWVLGLVALVAITTLAPQRSGPLALAAILLPHLALASVALVPLAVWARHRALGIALAALAVGCAVRFGPARVLAGSGDAAGPTIDVVTWNLGVRGTAPVDDLVAALLAADADVVALQELRPHVAARLEADPGIAARYPFRALAPDPTVLGVGLLSAFPLSAPEVSADPVAISAALNVGGRPLGVLTAHPMPGRIGVGPLGVPVSFDGTRRDASIARLRARVDALGHGGRLVLLGDFNLAPTELGYGALAAGLRDVHAAVGTGPGFTWRPAPLVALGVGLLRIDYVLVGPAVTPLATRVVCGPAGDHCLVAARLGIGPD